MLKSYLKRISEVAKREEMPKLKDELTEKDFRKLVLVTHIPQRNSMHFCANPLSIKGFDRF